MNKIIVVFKFGEFKNILTLTFKQFFSPITKTFEVLACFELNITSQSRNEETMHLENTDACRCECTFRSVSDWQTPKATNKTVSEDDFKRVKLSSF